MKKGKFITLEGGDGTGKTSQLPKLAEFLANKGISVHATREPGGSPGAELIRELLLTGNVERWDGVTEALLFNAARRDHLVSTIWPALEQGTWVVCDRFADSTLAFQGYGHNLPIEPLMQLYKLIAGDFKPDLTIVFDLDPAVGLARAQIRNSHEQRFEQMDLAFHNRLRAGYLDLAKQDFERHVVIDASQPVVQVFEAIKSTVCERFGIS